MLFDIRHDADKQERRKGKIQQESHGRTHFRALLSSSTLASRFRMPGKPPPRSSGSRQPSGIPCAEFPPFPEFSISIPAAGPTKSHAPAPPPHPHRRTGFHRSGEIAFRALTLRATIPAALRLADPAAAPAPCRAAPESAPATARCACRTCTPRQKTATPARAAPFRPYTHSPAKSSVLFFLTSLFRVVSALSPRQNLPRKTGPHCVPEISYAVFCLKKKKSSLSTPEVSY